MSQALCVTEKVVCTEWGNVMWGPDGVMCGMATIVHAVDVLYERITGLCYMRALKKTRAAGSTLEGMTEFV